MNLLEKAKVITTPTAYSDGILYSVKPSNAENLLLQSNQFDTTWSSNSGASVTSGQSGYDGSSDAWLLTKTTTSFANITQLISYSGVQTYSFYAKAGTTDWVAVYVQTTSSLPYCFFDLTNGVKGSPQNNVIDSSITSVGNGWYRIALVFNYTTTDVRIFPAEGNATLASQVGDNIYIQDAQLNKGYSADQYIETTTETSPRADFTFTRNSSATRVGEDGYIQDVQIIGGELVQNGDFEQIGSELVTNGSFDTDSGWDRIGTWSISSGQASANANSQSQYLQQDFSINNGKVYKFTYEIIENTLNGNGASLSTLGGFGSVPLSNVVGYHTEYIAASNQSATYALKIGVSGTATSGQITIDNVSVKEVGQNWTLTQATVEDGKLLLSTTDGSFSGATQTLGAIGRLYRITLDVADIIGTVSVAIGGGTDADITTNGTHTVEIISASTTFEIKRKFGVTNVSATIDNISVKEVTDDTNLPRINYEGFSYENGLPIYGSGKGHFLLEGQSTNVFTYSEDLSNIAYTKQRSNIISSNILNPFQSNVNEMVATSASPRFYRTIPITGGVLTTYSIFVKKKDYDVFLLQFGDNSGDEVHASFDLSTNSVSITRDDFTGSSAKIDVGYVNNWIRASLTFTIPTTANSTFYFQGTTSNIGDSIYINGIQVESGNISSYIPTNGSAVTRAAETCNNAGNADLFDSTEGVFYAEIAALSNSDDIRQLTISDGTSNNKIVISFDIENRINVKYRNSGINVFDEYYAATITDFNKIGIRYKQNEFSLWVNGYLIFLDTNGSVISADTLSKLSFDGGDGSFPMYSKTKMVATFPYLSDSEMGCLTRNLNSPFGPFYPFEQRVSADGGIMEGFTCLVDKIVSMPQADAGRQLFDAYDARCEAASGDTEARVCTINELNDLL